MFSFALPRRGTAHEVRILREHIKQLEALVIDMQSQLMYMGAPAPALRTAWNGSTNLVPIAPARLKPTRLVGHYEERRIDRVTITPSHKVMAYDQAGIPFQEFCGDFRSVGWAILQRFKGRWQEIAESSVELSQPLSLAK